MVGEDNLDRDPPSPGKFRFQVNLISFQRHIYSLCFYFKQACMTVK